MGNEDAKKWNLMRKNLTAALMMACIVLFAGPASLHAKAETVYHVSKTYVNPYYSDILSASDLDRPVYNADITGSDGTVYYDSVAKAGNALKNAMKQRQGTVVVGLITSDYNNSACSQPILTAALAHTGNPTEGDYIAWQYGGAHMSTTATQEGSVYHAKVTYTITYYDTLAQENAVTSKLDTLMPQLVDSSMTKYQKVSNIYEWICSNITYDHEHLGNNDYKLQFTAYAALVNKTAVCQGYANLFYRMCLTAGVDARLITGIGNGGNHAWNIVLMDDGKYYNVDSTWDATYLTQTGKYQCYLRNNSNFVDHTRGSDYTTATFNAAYPMGTVDYAPPTSGSGAGSSSGVGISGTTLPNTDAEDARNIYLFMMIISGVVFVGCLSGRKVKA